MLISFLIAVPISVLLIKAYEWFTMPEEYKGESFAVGDKLIFKAGANVGKRCIFLDASLIEFTVSLDDGRIIKCQEWEVTHDNAERPNRIKLVG